MKHFVFLHKTETKKFIRENLRYSRHKSFPEAITSSSPQDVREDIKRLQMIELQLKDDIQNLSLRRDSLVMELQQLQEAKPVLEKAYAVRAALANIESNCVY